MRQKQKIKGDVAGSPLFFAILGKKDIFSALLRFFKSVIQPSNAQFKPLADVGTDEGGVALAGALVAHGEAVRALLEDVELKGHFEFYQPLGKGNGVSHVNHGVIGGVPQKGGRGIAIYRKLGAAMDVILGVRLTREVYMTGRRARWRISRIA